MLTMLGSPRTCCDGVTRRETLRAGALTALGGFSLAHVLEAEASPVFDPRAAKAKNVLVIFLLGGAATQDMWDLKPDAPAEVRGEFKPIDTSAPGIRICELLPETAKWMHRGALIRSVNHKAGCHNTVPCYTGYEQPLADNTTIKDTYPPSMGSVLRYLDEQERLRKGLPAISGEELPGYLYLPCYLGWGQNIRRPGPYAGFLGQRYDALYTECAPFGDDSEPAPLPGTPRVVRGMPVVANSRLPDEITLDRLGKRKDLLVQMDDEMRRIDGLPSVWQHNKVKEQAYGMLASAKTRAAFDLTQEKPETVERYGKTLFGHSVLIGRRLIESGVRFVNVTWDLFWDRVKVDYDAWDTHTKNFEILKKNKLPYFDQTFSALLSDLHDRGLLDETLVLLTSEMGRTPRINANAGRDHWTNCYSSLFFGGGIPGGVVYGESDATAAFVKDKPVSTSDICATVYHQLGISPETTVPERNGRPVGIAHGGKPIAF